jgi:hypothetical protein
VDGGATAAVAVAIGWVSERARGGGQEERAGGVSDRRSEQEEGLGRVGAFVGWRRFSF